MNEGGKEGKENKKTRKNESLKTTNRKMHLGKVYIKI